MEQSVAEGWYDDPGGSGHLRWWDGARWTDHLHPAAPRSYPEGPFAGGPAGGDIYGGGNIYGDPGAYGGGPFAPVPGRSAGRRRNHYAVIAIGVAIAYLLLALTTGFVILGILPVGFAMRSRQAREPLAPAAIAVAAVALVAGLAGFVHR